MNVVVAGTGMTKFGELWGESLESLSRQVVIEALNDAKLRLDEIDLLVVGNKLLQQLEGRAHVGALVAAAIGFEGPSMHVEAACASGGLAVRQGLMAIRSGMARRVLVVGVEKMTDVDSMEITRALMSAASDEEMWAGATFAALYGLMTQAYLREHALQEDVLARPAIKNHEHAALNPLAQFQQRITAEMIEKSELVAEPLRQLHCSPISDGAAAVVLEGTDQDKGIGILGSGHAGEHLGIARRKTWSSIPATKTAAAAALSQSGVTMGDIKVLEVHDCFTIAELMAYEDLGLVKPGEGAMKMEQGLGWFGKSDVVVNSSGGLKACGHPVGATGVKQIVEITRQLRGGLGERQVPNARYGLTHNVGGTGGTVVVHVLGKLETRNSKSEKNGGSDEY